MRDGWYRDAVGRLPVQFSEFQRHFRRQDGRLSCGLAFECRSTTLHGKTNIEEAGLMDLWLFYSVGLPAIIVLIAYVAMRLHEWDLDRKHKNRHPGE